MEVSISATTAINELDPEINGAEAAEGSHISSTMQVRSFTLTEPPPPLPFTFWGFSHCNKCDPTMLLFSPPDLQFSQYLITSYKP
jgi:hypothetical protein